MNAARTLLTAVLAMTLAAPACGEELGRLFLSPAQRAAIDSARYAAPAPPEPAIAIGDEAPTTTAPADSAGEAVSAPLAVDGYVVRSGGPATVWINGTDASEGNLAEFGIDGRDVSVRHERVVVPLGSGDGSVELKPGQTFDPATAHVSDAYEQPPPAPADTAPP